MLIAIDGGDPRLVYQAVIEKNEDGAVESVELYLADPRQGPHAVKVRRYEGEKAQALAVAFRQHVIEV
jgi:hypothetical protein